MLFCILQEASILIISFSVGSERRRSERTKTTSYAGEIKEKFLQKVGAGAAALAALHPMDFDPDDKLTFSAG